MSRRDLLHHTQAERFVSWAIGRGFTTQPTTNCYEVFRLRDQGGRLHVGYKRNRTDHITVTHPVMVRTVRQFIAERLKQIQ